VFYSIREVASHVYENNEEPILEIAGFDTRTGNNDYLKMEWE
jgi:hypothetical protein